MHIVILSHTIPVCISYLNSLVHVLLFTSLQCGVDSGRVWSVKGCGVSSVESVKCLKCRMRSVKSRVWSMECKMSSVGCGQGCKVHCVECGV